MITIHDALINLCKENHPNCGIGIQGEFKTEDDFNNNVFLEDNTSLKAVNKDFIWDDILSRQTELQAEYDAQEYARNRARAYYSVGDQLDQLMKDMRDGTTTHQTACEAVKTKYPKG